MKKISQALLLILLSAFVISACSPASGTPTLAPIRPMLARDAVDSYSAEFNLQFSGAKAWSYSLKIHKTPTLREINLHIEGVPAAQNPGDIRMVTDNKTTWMTGAGTDNQCVQFPNGQGMDPTYIYPESLVSLSALGSALQKVDDAGAETLHYRAAGAASGPWKDAAVEIWQDRSTGMLRQFSMSAAGEDPFFGAGAGKLNAKYSAGALSKASIEPVSGCQVDAPLPDAISNFVRLPGMASFHSQGSLADMLKFYQTNLPLQKWAEKDPPAQADGSTILSYQRGGETLEIHLQSDPDGGSAVKLIFIQ